MSTLFISDLHLSAERPAITDLFLRFLRERAADAEALYILGDLFEYWVGDDACDEAEYAPLIAGLHALTDGGVPVYVMHGNRDFLLGQRFCQATGAQLLPDPAIVDLYGERTLLMHGDTLCTDDVDYQRFRLFIRQPAQIQGFLSKSLAERNAMLRGYREMSKAATAQKAEDIMDVNRDAVVATLRDHGVRMLVHGHTHRPADHRMEMDGAPARRIVLGDWYEQGSVLQRDAAGWRLENLR